MKLLPVVALLFTTGCYGGSMSCADGQYYSYEFNGPDEDYPLALSAAEEWNACGQLYADVRRAPFDGAIKLLYFPQLWSSGLAGDDAIEYTHVPHTQALLEHEMGHTFGLGHYGDGLMNGDMLQFHVEPNDCDALRHRVSFHTPTG